MQVGQEAATLLVVGMGNAVAHGNALARNFADAAHKSPREFSELTIGAPTCGAERAAFIPVGPVPGNCECNRRRSPNGAAQAHQSNPRSANDRQWLSPTIRWSSTRMSTSAS